MGNRPNMMVDPDGGWSGGGGDGCGWFCRNISRPLGNLFNNVFGGGSKNNPSSSDSSSGSWNIAAEIIELQDMIVQADTPEGRENIKSHINQMHFNALDRLNQGMKGMVQVTEYVDVVGVTDYARMSAAASGDVSYNQYNSIFGTDHSAVNDGVWTAAGFTPIRIVKFGKLGGKSLSKIGYKISKVAPDWGTKGAHIHIDGVELAVRPTNVKGEVIFKPVFSSSSDKSVEGAIKKAEKLINNEKFRNELIQKSESAMKMLNGSGKSAELNFLLKSLKN